MRALDLESAATCMEMSEDGKFLAIAHEGDNLVSIYDVLAGVVAGEFECPAPRNVLWRGNQIITASRNEGVIRFFVQRNGNWTQTREWRVPKTGVVHIAAASGKAFKGQLFVTCHGEGSQAFYRDSMIYATSPNGRFVPISKSALGTSSYDGRMFLRHESFNLSSGGQITGYLTQEYVRSGGDSREVVKGDARSNTYLYQVAPGGYWIGRNVVLAGVPLSQVPGTWGDLIIPDRTQRTVYVIDDDVILGRKLSVSAADLGVRRLTLPGSFQEMDQLRHGWAHRRNYLLDHPEAATHGNTTHLFIRAAEGGVILAARTPAFQPQAAQPNRGVGNENLAGAGLQLAPLGTAIDAKPRTWKSKTGKFSVVATLLRPENASIVLQRSDNGTEITVPITALSEADMSYLRRQQRQAPRVPRQAADLDFLAKVDRMEQGNNVDNPLTERVMSEDPAGRTIEPPVVSRSPLGSPLASPSDPFPSTDELEPRLAQTAAAIAALDKDALNQQRTVIKQMGADGTDISPLLPHLAWGLMQNDIDSLYTCYVLDVTQSTLESPGADAILPDLLRFAETKLAEEDTNCLWRALPAIATLGHYDFILPGLDHPNEEIRGASLKSIVHLMHQRVTPSPTMMDRVWILSEDKEAIREMIESGKANHIRIQKKVPGGVAGDG